MSETKILVLNHKQIGQKITRMAYEIYERNASEKGILIAGINGMGFILAQLLAKALEEISPLQAEVLEVQFDKSKTSKGNIQLSKSVEMKGKTVVLVDDVLNTGKTLLYGLEPFLENAVKKIEVAVLVNRSHKLYPVTPDYTGLELATTLTEHIDVDLSKENFSAYLH